MKVAVYIENGLQQVVLTPENSFERNIINSMNDKTRELKMHRGSFYECRGGWVRQSVDDASMIIILRDHEESSCVLNDSGAQ